MNRELCIAVKLAFIIVVIPMEILADEPKEPSWRERQNFLSHLKRLEEHAKLLPRAANGVITTLTDTLRVTFECPEGARVSKVTLKITTRQIKWDRNLTVHGKKLDIPNDGVGYYIWYPTITVRDNEKFVLANNFIMLDSAALGGQATDSLPDFWLAEALLYHELLHGQLMIGALTERTWQADVCGCNMNLSSRDAEHERIPDFVLTYLENLAAADERVYAVSVPAASAKGAGREFKIVIHDVDIVGKPGKWEAMSYYPEYSNVDQSSFRVELEGEEITAYGEKIDNTKRGLVIINFTPRN